MNDKNLHINTKEEDLLKNLKPSYIQSKEDVWEDLSQLLEAPFIAKSQSKLINMMWFRAAVAVFILLLSTGIFLRTYSVTIKTGKGEHLSHQLPDGSVVELNAESSISYNPYWWWFSREMDFEGEAFFQVENGISFTVNSNNGKTEVLGTSFNIYSRNQNYRVFCKTGKVRVSDADNKIEMIIEPGEMAEIIANKGKIEEINAENILAWKNNMFNFIAEPLPFVLEEIERQYNVRLETEIPNLSELFYSGYFTKSETLDSTLYLICHTFGLTFAKQNENNYKVFQK